MAETTTLATGTVTSATEFLNQNEWDNNKLSLGALRDFKKESLLSDGVESMIPNKSVMGS